jgi:hypothetical protein
MNAVFIVGYCLGLLCGIVLGLAIANLIVSIIQRKMKP